MLGKAKFLYGVSCGLGALVLFWGYENLFPIEHMENRLVEEYLSNWYTAPIIARVFIALNFITGVFLLLNINPGNYLPKVFLVMMSLGIYDLTWESFTTTDIITPGYSRFFDTDLYVSILLCSILVFAALVLVRLGKASDMKRTWLKYPIGISLFALPFILNPVYPADLMDQSVRVGGTFDLKAFGRLPEEHLSNDKALLTLYSTSCPHCLNAMRRLAISRNQSQEYIPVFIGFLGSEAGITSFFNEARAAFDYTILEMEQFYKLSGSTYPSFVLLEKGEPTWRWDGRTFNYHTLQEFAQ
ncbi:MAG: hypothetical protein JKY52_17655 [Flavobacteriales bacterium]|nr:hypothetical protein [Flavobacteriales bacterium]